MILQGFFEVFKTVLQGFLVRRDSFAGVFASLRQFCKSFVFFKQFQAFCFFKNSFYNGCCFLKAVLQGFFEVFKTVLQGVLVVEAVLQVFLHPDRKTSFTKGFCFFKAVFARVVASLREFCKFFSLRQFYKGSGSL